MSHVRTIERYLVQRGNGIWFPVAKRVALRHETYRRQTATVTISDWKDES